MDQSFQNYCSSMVPLRLDKYQRQTMAQEALQALLEVTGKAILLGQGSGATMAWLATDVAHEQVAAVVAVEASGPPFGLVIGNDRRLEGAARYKEYTRYDPKIRRWGLADIPLTYHPPLPAPNDLSNKDDFDEKPLFDLEVKRWAEDDRKASVFQQVSSLIKGDARCHTLHNLRKVPHAFVTAEASFHTSYDWATVKFMRDAQVAVDWIRLERHGIRGNGHLMFLEKNSDQVASLIHYWIMRQMGSSSAVFHC
jgi:pimeloyl-ACP methyl ester carboxylesterase